MKINLYAIKDVLNGFAAPVVMPNHESAIRWFDDMSSSNPTIGNHMEDFTVHYMGNMDVETGEIVPADEKYLKKHLANFMGEVNKNDDN